MPLVWLVLGGLVGFALGRKSAGASVLPDRLKRLVQVSGVDPVVRQGQTYAFVAVAPMGPDEFIRCMSEIGAELLNLDGTARGALSGAFVWRGPDSEPVEHLDAVTWLHLDPVYPTSVGTMQRTAFYNPMLSEADDPWNRDPDEPAPSDDADSNVMGDLSVGHCHD